MTKALIGWVLALALTVLAAPSTAATHAAEAGRPSTSEEPRFAPGRYGALRVGMTTDEATETGLVRWVYQDEYCGYQLQFRWPYRRAWVVTNPEETRVLAMGTYLRGPSTTKGVDRGTPLRVVRRKYDDRLRGPYVNEYQQKVFTVRRGKAYMTLFFNAARLRPRSPLGAIIVSRHRPIRIFEGEGPC